MEPDDHDNRTIPKPDELLALYGVTTELFVILKRWFAVPDSVSLDLSGIDAATAEMGDPVMIAALAMRKLQALHLLTTPGVRTTTDVVLTVIQDLERALLQAPNMHLRRTAEATDWDMALQALDVSNLGPAEGDDEIETFRRHHAALHEAARAVLHASDGEIRTLV